MAHKRIIIKTMINKRTKQRSIAIPKKKLRLLDPTLKFDEDLFVSLSVFNKKRG